MTFSVAVSGDDGQVSVVNSSSYPPTPPPTATSLETTITAERSLSSSGLYIVRVGLMRWDTSALATLPANATITGATLRAYVGVANNSTDARSVAVEWYSAANWPIDAADYTATAPPTPAASAPLSAVAVNAMNSLAITDLTGINTSGYTGMRFHITGSAPTGPNSVTVSAFDHATDPAPDLIITYTFPVVKLVGALTGSAAATVPATLKVGHLISGGAIGAATTTATIRVIHNLSGGLTGAATATAIIKVVHTLAGVTMGAADATGSLQLKHTMSASAIAGGAVSARLSGTFVVTAELDDGFLFQESGGMTSHTNTVQRGDTPNSAAVGIVRFDTSSLPDNTVVTAAYLRLYITGVQGREGVWSIIGEYYNALGGTPPPRPVNQTDWTDTPPAVPLFSVDQVSIPNSGWLNVPINSYDGVIANGYTAFRLHISQGQGTYPTRGIFFAGFSSSESPEAQLVISYGIYALLTGVGQGAATTAATLTVTHHAAGSAYATAVILGSLDKSAYLITGAVNGHGVLSASLDNTTHLTGASTGMASLQASLSITTHLAGTANGAATINAMLNRTIAMVASVDGAATANAGLSVTYHLQAAPIGQGRVDGLLSLPSFIGGAVRGTGFTSAVITHIVHVAAVVTASATAVATPQVFKNMVGSLAGQALVTANLRISHVRMEGVFTGQAVLSGSLRIAHRMQGFTIGTATAQATMGPVNHLNGIVTGTAVSVVVLRHIVHARGVVHGQAYTSAVLMWVNIQTIHCEPLTGVHTAPGCTGLSPVATISSGNLVTLHTIGK